MPHSKAQFLEDYLEHNHTSTLREQTIEWEITENYGGVFKNQFVFESKWEETYTEATQSKQ